MRAEAVACEEADHAPVLHRQFDGVETLEKRNRRRGQRPLGKRA